MPIVPTIGPNGRVVATMVVLDAEGIAYKPLGPSPENPSYIQLVEVSPEEVAEARTLLEANLVKSLAVTAGT